MKEKLKNVFSVSRDGFTLVELLGISAVIAVLAAVVTPKVLDVIARDKVEITAQAYEALTAATIDYFSHHGSFPLRAGSGRSNGAVSDGRFDADLVAGGFLKKLVTSGLGRSGDAAIALNERTHVRSLRAVAGATVTPPSAGAGGDNFDLDHNPATAEFSADQRVISLFIPGVTLPDAVALNRLIDGDTQSGPAGDIVGKCIYGAPADENGLVTVCIYVAHF